MLNFRNMINSNLFFGNFQRNYFDYKQNSLKFLLDNYSKIGLEEIILEYKDKDYITAIRSDIRQTFFQAIETVFEIFFALLPDKNGIIISDKIIERITLSDLPYTNIRRIAENIDSLDILNGDIELPNGKKISIGEYVFYFGVSQNVRNKNNILESIGAIKYALNILAKEFSDRTEYNSYKHGLRILPALQKLSVCDVETMEKEISWDLDGSMTFYSYDKKTNESIYTTKTFDSDKDVRMTSLCSSLIWNMIKLRDIAYNWEKKYNDSKFEIPFYSKESIDDAIKTNVKIQYLKYSIKNENN